MTKLNPNYVLAPFYTLLTHCQGNVLMGLRIIERADALPPPTPEELQFLFQLSFSGHPHPADIEESKSLFKRWVLLNGFGDVHKAIGLALQRLIIFKTVEQEMLSGSNVNIDELERELRAKVSKFHFPALIKEVNSLCTEPFEYEKHAMSFNAARNCLEHANGVVTERHCNNPPIDKVIISGLKFKMFFKRDDEEVLAEIGKSGPENAALMLGAEEFQIEFTLGQTIELSLKQFIDVLNTCVFIRADVGSKLS